MEASTELAFIAGLLCRTAVDVYIDGRTFSPTPDAHLAVPFNTGIAALPTSQHRLEDM